MSVILNRELGVDFTRAAIAIAAARGDLTAAADSAASVLGQGSTLASCIKASVGAHDVGDWPSVRFDQLSAREFVGLIEQQSLLGRIAGFRRVPLGIRVPRQRAGVGAAWVAGMQLIPVGEADFAAVSLDALKIGAITVTTRELLRFGPRTEAILRADLVRAATEATDTHFLSDAAAIPGTCPAGILNGVTPVAATSDLRADLAQLLDGFEGDLDAAVLITHPKTAARLSLMLDDDRLGARGGELAGLPLFTSRYAEKGAIVLLDPTGVVVADDGVIELGTSEAGTITLSSSPGEEEESPVSLWQHGLVALRMIRFINWQPARAVAVSALTGVGG